MSIDGTYAGTATLGTRTETGTVEIMSEESTVWLTLHAPVVGTVEATGNMTSEDSFTASGSIRVLLEKITYTITGRVKDDTLIAVCETNMGTAEVVGKRIS